MTWVLVGVWLALAGALGAFVMAVVGLRVEEARVWAARSALAAWVLVSIPLTLLAVAFLSGRLDVFYVWSNVDVAYPWWLRLAGLWGGHEGTFLLWAWVVLGAIVVEDRRAGNAAWLIGRGVASLASVFLLAPLVVQGVGLETVSFGLTGDGSWVRGGGGPSPLSLRPMGAGLNPLLESVYMAIHPFVMFLAYGLAVVPFAYGVAHLATGRRGWLAPARAWARAAWLAFLAALTLGSLWAYHVLSFGGYWIWDPVEVGNLLPFLALSLFLHAAPARGGGRFGLLAPGSAVLAVVMVVFTGFVVRSGLWSSVHAFLPSGVSVSMANPLERLRVVAEASFQARYAFSFLAVTVGGAMGSVCAFLARDRPAGSVSRGASWAGVGVFGLVAVVGLVAPVTLVGVLEGLVMALGWGRPLVGVGVLLALVAVPFVAGLFWMGEDLPLGLTSGVGRLVWACVALGVLLAVSFVLLVLGVNGYGEEVFTARAPFLAGPLLALLGVGFGARRGGRWVWVVVGALVAGLGVRWAWGSWAWAGVPLAVVVLVGLVHRYVRAALPGARGGSYARSVVLVVGGVAGLVQWASPGVVGVGGVGVAFPVWFVPLGLALGGVALLAPSLEARGVPPWVGPLACVGAVGYGVSVVAGVAAWALRGSGFEARGSSVRSLVPLVHVGLVLVLVGVAASTYGGLGGGAGKEDPLERGAALEVGAWEVVFVDGGVVDMDGRVVEAWAVVHVFERGVFVGEERLVLSYHRDAGVGGAGSFVPEESPVSRSWWGDLAHNADTEVPLSLRLGDEEGTWVTANGPGVGLGEGEEVGVEAVSVGVESLPLVNLVWAGSVVMFLAVGARVLQGAAGRGRTS